MKNWSIRRIPCEEVPDQVLIIHYKTPNIIDDARVISQSEGWELYDELKKTLTKMKRADRRKKK